MTSIRIRYYIDALKAEALIKASGYLDRRAERLVSGLLMDEQHLEVCEETWCSIYKQRWPEEFKKATEEPPF